jgi:MFS family permease
MSMPFKIDSTPGSSNVNTPLPSYPPSLQNDSHETLSEKMQPPPDYSSDSSNNSVWDPESGSVHSIKAEPSSDPDFVDHGILDRVLSRVSTKEPGPPPNGGWAAWSQVVIGHLIIFNTWGYINSFGLFQAYYVDALQRPPSDIAWVGSVQIWLTFSFGAIAGRATDAGYFKFIITLGLILQLTGIFCTSVATEYWQMFLAQGICQGIGCGLCFCSTVTVVSTYFTTKRSLAIASTACGAATGGIVFPLIAQQLLTKIGFGWTVRVMGFVVLANASIAIAFARARVPPRRSGPFIEWSAFKELPFVIFNIGAFLILWGVYVAYYYVSFTFSLLLIFFFLFSFFSSSHGSGGPVFPTLANTQDSF